VAGTDTQPTDVVRRYAADDAVEDLAFEIAFVIALHRQELGTEHLEVHGERRRSVDAGIDGLVDEVVHVGSLLGDAPDRSLEDLALVGLHWR
jgi:hypothetical protein